MPFNASNPILAYNRDAFRRAGLDPDRSPKTFDAVTRGAQIGPFDTVRSIIEEGVESIDGVEEVPAALDRIDGKVESTLESYSSRP